VPIDDIASAGIPNDTGAQMQATPKAAGATSEILLRPDMPRGVHADLRTRGAAPSA